MKFLLLSILLLVATNCTKQQIITIYTIDTNINIKKIKNSDYKDNTIKIAYPKGINSMMGRNILFNYKNNEDAIYQNGIWSNSANRLIMSYIHHIIDGSSIFKNTINYSSYAKFDYILEIYIDKFYHKIRQNHSKSILSIRFNLLYINNKIIVKTKKFNYQISTTSRDLAGYIEATQKIFYLLNIDLINWLKKS